MSIASLALGTGYLRRLPDRGASLSRSADPGRLHAPQCGAGAVEFLVAVPVMLLLGLLIWQWALVMQSRAIVDFAAREAARSGALGHAAPEAIEQGIISGLTPLWVSITELAGPASALRASAIRFRVAAHEGWLTWRQLSPTRESFSDWGTQVAAGVRAGLADAALEIPLDNPSFRSRYGAPLSVRERVGSDIEHAPVASSSVSLAVPRPGPLTAPGAESLAASGSGSPTAEPVGPASGQTFREAGILRLELSVGVPLHVPLAGRFISWAARMLGGCEAREPPHLGALRLDGPGAAVSTPTGLLGAEPSRGLRSDPAPACAQFSGLDHSGHVLPRLPVKVVGEARIQSAARVSTRTPVGAGVKGSGGRGLSIPNTSDSDWQNPPQRPLDAVGHLPGGPVFSMIAPESSSSQATGAERQPGFLQLGGEREIWVPGACGFSAS